MIAQKDWFVSSYTAANNTCVEVKVSEEAVDVRNSTNPTGPVVSFTKAEWRAFLAGARDGEFDV